MIRNLLLGLSVAACLTGCGRSQWSMETPRSGPAPEMKNLDRLVGSWAGTAEMVEPSPEEMKERMPEGAPEMPTTFKGGGKSEWALGGTYLKSDGWHEMGDNKKATYVEYVTWDADKCKFRTWYIGDNGEYGQGWMTPDKDGNTFHFQARGVNYFGKSMKGEGTMRFVNNDTVEWDWTERSGLFNKMSLKGTNKRVR